MRTTISFEVDDVENFKNQLLEWSSKFEDVVWLDSNFHNDQYSTYDAVLAAEAFTSIKTDYTRAIDSISEYSKMTKDWIFGYISYEVKNGIEKLSSNNDDYLLFPDLYFFQPQRLFFINQNKVECHYLNVVSDEIEDDLKDIRRINFIYNQVKKSPPNILSKLTKSEYIGKVNAILEHIKKGNIYEINFCQEYYINNHTFEPILIFKNLNSISKPPFACFLKQKDLYAIGASPERFIKKIGNKIISQPIKGTARRDHNLKLDNELKRDLKANQKEISENVMIVDLVRNDLSKIANKNSVLVEELCEIYTFEQVHQMISTISAKVDKDINFGDILRACFPMGSMTGTPKISAMEIAEELETTKRGLYSGCIGYISPNNNFDFNVVIRSILHNTETKYTSMMVGSAITNKSEPDKEYEECLVKANALFKVLGETSFREKSNNKPIST